MASRAVFLLVPPSEAKAPGGVLRVKKTPLDRRLGEARRMVTAAVTTALNLPELEQSRLFAVRGPLLARCRESMGELVAGTGRYLPAWQRYDGVVWTHLESGALSEAQRSRLIIPSGFYGLSTGNDLIGDYRLKMSANLPPLGNLATWWRPRISPEVAHLAAGAVLVDLLPNEHRSAIDDEMIGATCDLVRVDFVSAAGSGAAGHAAKAVKGRVARFLLDTESADLGAFRWAGWRAQRVSGGFVVRAPR